MSGVNTSAKRCVVLSDEDRMILYRRPQMAEHFRGWGTDSVRFDDGTDFRAMLGCERSPRAPRRWHSWIPVPTVQQ